MADTKLTALTATTAIDGTEAFYVVEDPSGTPLSRKVLGSDVKTYMSAGVGGTPGGSTLQFQYNNASAFDGANLYRESADIIAQRNSTTAQVFYIYGTYTNASNFERLNVGYDGAFYNLYMDKAGTGSTRPIFIGVGGTNANLLLATNGNVIIGAGWTFLTGGHFVSQGDNIYDIGASGATRPRNIYIGTGVYFTERTAPSAPPTNEVVMYAEDNGAGKTRLMARFATGAAVQIAIEP